MCSAWEEEIAMLKDYNLICYYESGHTKEDRNLTDAEQDI